MVPSLTALLGLPFSLLVTAALMPALRAFSILPERNTMTRATSISETSDTYPKVVSQPQACVRVITCKGDLQWILQKRSGGGGEWPWKAVGYFRTRKALVRATAALCGRGESSPEAMEALQALPENFAAFKHPQPLRPVTKETTQ